jgi:hypothetical protein
VAFQGDGEWGVGAVDVRLVRPVTPVGPVSGARGTGSSGEAGLDAVWLPLWPGIGLCIKKRELFDSESHRGDMGRGGSCES